MLQIKTLYTSFKIEIKIMKKPQVIEIINRLRFFKVSEMRFELTQPFGHYPLKVACLPIPPPGRNVCQNDFREY